MNHRVGTLPVSALVAAALVLAACDSRDNGESVGGGESAATPVQQTPRDVMVSTPNPLATEIGLMMLRDGGSAVDAAIAVALVLGFVEMPETGIGGGGFLMHYAAADAATQFYDGRETAPLAAEPGRFSLWGIPVPLYAAVPTGRAVGVPGLLAMLDQAHRDHGRLPWPDLVRPAADLARYGVPMPERLRQQIEADPTLYLFADTRRYFLEQAGDESPRLVNPPLADTLDRIATHGASALYRPPLSSAIIEQAADTWLWPSDLTQADFDHYRAVRRPPVCGRYRQWRVCGAGPPSSGGVAVIQILGQLSRFDMAAYQPDDVEAWHLIVESTRLAFADRYRYIGDPDAVEVPVDALTDADYLAQRSARIQPDRALADLSWGDPPGDGASASTPTFQRTRSGTSHISIVDGDGNAVALTGSNEKPFGTRMMAAGFILNNQLTDFTFDPRAAFGAHPNAPGPAKRPRSSMSPVLVFNDDDELVLVIGSRGGGRIISYVVKTLIGVLDWQLTVQQAIELPNVVYAGDAVELEAATRAEQWLEPLRALGHEVGVETLTSGLHGVQRWQGGWRGGADPRLEGTAQGYSRREAP